MERSIPLRVLGGLPALRVFRGGARNRSCPVMAPARDAVVRRVKSRLEAARCRELRRRRATLKGLSEAQRETVDRFTRNLLQRAVLDGLNRVAGEGCTPGAELLMEIRKIFP